MESSSVKWKKLDGEKKLPCPIATKKSMEIKNWFDSRVFWLRMVFTAARAFFRSADAVTFRAWNSDDIVVTSPPGSFDSFSRGYLADVFGFLLRLVWRVNVNLYARTLQTMTWCYMMLFIFFCSFIYWVFVFVFDQGFLITFTSQGLIFQNTPTDPTPDDG